MSRRRHRRRHIAHVVHHGAGRCSTGRRVGSRGFSNSSPHRSTRRTRRILALAVMAQNRPRRETVRNSTVVVFAAFHVAPQPFHIGAVLRDGAPSIFVRALGRMMKQKQSLLLVLYSHLPLWIIPIAHKRLRTEVVNRWPLLLRRLLLLLLRLLLVLLLLLLWVTGHSTLRPH